MHYLKRYIYRRSVNLIYIFKKDFKSAINKYRESLGLIDQLIAFEKPGDDDWTRIDKMVAFLI